MVSGIAERLSRLRLVVLVLGAVVLAGCDAQLLVRADVEEDGSGTVVATVELDQQATASILDLDTVGLALADLDDAGWQTEPPERLASGGLRLTASKDFGTPEQFREVLDEIAGDAGLFQDFDLSREKAFARIDYELRGEIVPVPLESFADPALEAALGRPLSSIAADYGATNSDVSVELRVGLPGDPRELTDITGEVPSDESGTVRVWTANLAETAATEVVIASSSRTVAALVWRGVAIVAAVLAGLVLLGQVLRVLRPQARRSRNRPSAASAPRPRPRPPVVPAEETAVEIDETRASPVVVALDGMGVVYREGNDIHEILIPFVREKGSDVTEDEIVARARSLSLGRITPADFWSAIGVDGDPNELDEEYLSRHQLSPGVIKFLRTLRDQGVQVACVTNDATVWANKLRARHSLDGLIDPWIMSGAVGVRKPDPPIYEVLRRVTGQPPALIMVVDDDLRNLDAARDLGFRTAWFNPEARPETANGHAILRSFEVQAPDPASA